MKIILTQNIDRLGKTGDIITVKDGYARNYLFPKKIAKEATPANISQLEGLKKKQTLEEEKALEEARGLAERIGVLSITISAKAGEEDKLFGAVTADMVSKALEAEGISIDKKEIILDEPIKKLGIYQVGVKVHPAVKAALRVWVVKE